MAVVIVAVATVVVVGSGDRSINTNSDSIIIISSSAGSRPATPHIVHGRLRSVIHDLVYAWGRQSHDYRFGRVALPIDEFVFELDRCSAASKAPSRRPNACSTRYDEKRARENISGLAQSWYAK